MARPHDIVCIVHSLGVGGLENGVVNLLNRLPRELYRFTILAIEPVWTLRERIEREDVRYFSVGKRWGHDPLLPVRLIQVLRSLRPDLVHTRNWSTIEGVAAARFAGVPAVVHGEHGLNLDEAEALKPRRLAGRRLFYRMTDRIVTVTDTFRDTLAAGIPAAKEKLLTIRNGVDLDRFRPGRSRAEARRELGIDPSQTAIGSVGRLDPVKDYPVLVRALSRLREDRDDLCLVLVGDGPEREPLRQLARELGIATHVRIDGARERLCRLYPAFDVFVLTSRTEGMSNTLLEAMATGLPIVATRVGGNSEVVVDGENGFLVPPENSDQLAIALRTLLEDPMLREEMGRAARRRAERLFSLVRMVESYDQLYRSVLGLEPSPIWPPPAANSPSPSL